MKSGEKELKHQLKDRLIIAMKVGVYFIVVFLTLEYVFLPRTEKSIPDQLVMQLNSYDWKEENFRIYKNNSAEIINDSNWIWRTTNYQVKEGKSDKKRILVMGDSFVWGDGCSNFNDTWWRQLQQELISRGYDVEVIAAGKNGASTHNQFNQVQKIVDLYHPDLIIWGYVTNDPDEGVIKLPDSALPEVDSIYKSHIWFVRNGIFPRLNFQLSSMRDQKLNWKYSSYEQWELKLLTEENLNKYSAALQQVAKWSEEKGIPYFFITLPNWPDVEYFGERYSKVEPLFYSARIPFYNIIEEFAEEYLLTNSKLQWGINPANGHPGPVSTIFFAQQAANIIEQDFSWVLGERHNYQMQQPEINQWRPWNLEVTRLTQDTVEFTYPESDELMLRMPFDKPYVQFNFAYPIALREIQLRGPDLQAATIYFTGEDPDQLTQSIKVVDSGEKLGNFMIWSTANYQFKNKISTIRISADFTGSNRSLKMKLLFSEVQQ